MSISEHTHRVNDIRATCWKWGAITAAGQVLRPVHPQFTRSCLPAGIRARFCRWSGTLLPACRLRAEQEESGVKYRGLVVQQQDELLRTWAASLVTSLGGWPSAAWGSSCVAGSERFCMVAHSRGLREQAAATPGDSASTERNMLAMTSAILSRLVVPSMACVPQKRTLILASYMMLRHSHGTEFV